ncbi:MAG: FlgD immunoglobulin-like domain containing protein, partial [bacterium]
LQPLPQQILSRSRLSHPDDADASNNFGSSSVTVIAPPPSVLECYLDRNVFEPNLEPVLGVNLGLTIDSFVEINVHDLSGTLIKRLENRAFHAGQHRIEWNGASENGQNAGSGFYLITVRTKETIFYKKLFLIR